MDIKKEKYRRKMLMECLSKQIEQLIGKEEDFLTPIPGLAVFRRDCVSKACPCLYESGVVFVTQGAKLMQLGGQTYQYDSDHFLMTSLALPASTQVIIADENTPCFGFSLRLDRDIIADQITHIKPSFFEKRDQKILCASVGHVTNSLLENMNRLFSLIDELESIPILLPLILREIHYRLLSSEMFNLMQNMLTSGGAESKVSQAIRWIRNNFDQPMRIETLAEYLHMSPSSLHSHFRQMTGHSPLQYQKWLRINEARRLMLSEQISVASVSYQVGYESPSHFSRDYRRLLGAPPKNDISQILSYH